MNQFLYSPREAADALGVGRTTVFALIKSGDLDSIKVRSARRIPVVAVEDFIARQASTTGQATTATGPTTATVIALRGEGDDAQSAELS